MAVDQLPDELNDIYWNSTAKFIDAALSVIRNIRHDQDLRGDTPNLIALLQYVKISQLLKVDDRWHHLPKSNFVKLRLSASFYRLGPKTKDVERCRGSRFMQIRRPCDENEMTLR